MQLLLSLLYAPAFIRDFRSHRLKQKRKVRKHLKSHSPKPDIMGKTVSPLSQPKPSTAISAKALAASPNSTTFEPRNSPMQAEAAKQALSPVADAELDQLFTTEPSNPLIYQLPIESYPMVDLEEEQEIESPLYQAPIASGLGFDQLTRSFQTAKSTKRASESERLSAGETLLDIRKTDLFEQLLSHSDQTKLNVAKLIDESLADYHARHQCASRRQAANKPSVEAIDFDIRDYV